MPFGNCYGAIIFYFPKQLWVLIRIGSAFLIEYAMKEKISLKMEENHH
jgi:hypothetical protein